MIKESELKITGKTLAERTIEVLRQFLDDKATLPDDIWNEIATNVKTIGKNSAGTFVCDTAEKITNLFFEHVTDITFTDAERDVLLNDIEIIVSESFANETAAYYYVYAVSNHKNPTVARHITENNAFSNLDDARNWRDNADDYFDTIFKLKMNASGRIDWNFVMSVEKLNRTVEIIIRNLTEAIAEHEEYVNNPDYNELEQHDARVSIETFQSVLNFINRIMNY